MKIGNNSYMLCKSKNFRCFQLLRLIAAIYNFMFRPAIKDIFNSFSPVKLQLCWRYGNFLVRRYFSFPEDICNNLGLSLHRQNVWKLKGLPLAAWVKLCDPQRSQSCDLLKIILLVELSIDAKALFESFQELDLVNLVNISPKLLNHLRIKSIII